MSTQETGEADVIVTPRLVFDGAHTEVARIIENTPAADIDNIGKSQQEFPTRVENDADMGIDMAGNSHNFDEMSVEELRRQQEEIDRKIQEKQKAEKKAVIDQIVNVVNTYQIPVEELVEALGGMKVKRKGAKAKPKYRDPVTGTIWTGRGKEPAWIRGKDRKAFLIA